MALREPQTASLVLRYLGLLFLGGASLLGCTATWQHPGTDSAPAFSARVQTAMGNGITVTVGVPSKEETIEIFATDLYASRIQPVWINVENNTAQELILMRSALDDVYMSPAEASYTRHSGSQEQTRAMDRFFFQSEFKNPVPPKGTVSGYVFTNLDLGYKNINIDLLGDESVESFSFVVGVPGLNLDFEHVDLDALYEEIEIIDDMAQLRKRLMAEPCCTTNKKQSSNGDPLNIVLIGNREVISTALIRRGWQATEATHFGSSMKTVRSFFFGIQYFYSPISPLYVFGRSQDIGLQKAHWGVSRRNHIRLWRAPYNFRDQEVYIGQISRDIGVKFQKQTLTTHAIDPYVDSTRDGLIEDLAFSQNVAGVAFVSGSQVSLEESPNFNLTPDPYYSDGYRAVLFFSEDAVPLNEIERIPWLPYWHPSAAPSIAP